MESVHSIDRFAFRHQNEPLLYQFLLHVSLQTLSAFDLYPDGKEITSLAGECAQSWYTEKQPLRKIGQCLELMAAHFEPFETAERHYQELLSKTVANQCSLADARAQTVDLVALFLDQLPRYKASAPVIYYLLKHQTCFDYYLVKPTIAERLENLFAEGVKELEQFVSIRFAERGFHHLLPKISAQVSRLAHG